MIHLLIVFFQGIAEVFSDSELQGATPKSMPYSPLILKQSKNHFFALPGPGYSWMNRLGLC
jgi:hypothetical protein